MNIFTPPYYTQKTESEPKSEPLNVLIILSRYDKTGMTTNTVDLCEGLINIGHHVTLIVAYPITDFEQRFQQHLIAVGVDVKNFPNIGNTKISQIKSTTKILFYLLYLKYDVIHVESPYLTFIPWLLRKKFTSTFHVNDLECCFYYKNATHLVAISNETKEYAIKKFGFNVDDITIVNHGVSSRFAEKLSTSEKDNIKQKYAIPTNKYIIGFVGSIERRKGHDILIKAVENLPSEQREKVHIVFLGDDKSGNNIRWLEGVISNSEIKDQITKIGYTDPKPLYQIFDIFCLPSRLEGFGLVVIEAMIAGNLVIRSNTEGAYDQIKNGETGYIFENENITQLSQILSTVISNPSFMRDISQRGQEDALQRFTLEVMAKNTVKVYRKIIDKQ